MQQSFQRDSERVPHEVRPRGVSFVEGDFAVFFVLFCVFLNFYLNMCYFQNQGNIIYVKLYSDNNYIQIALTLRINIEI